MKIKLERESSCSRLFEIEEAVPDWRNNKFIEFIELEIEMSFMMFLQN